MFLFSIQFSFIRFQNYICLFQFLVMFYCLIFSLYSFIKVFMILICQRKHLFKASDLCLHRDLSLKKITNTSYGGKNNQMNIN